MKISLRKANALQLAISEMINDISINTMVEISPFENAMEVICSKRDELFQNMEKIETLRNILYDIRKKVSYANSTCGVDDILADIACIEKNIKSYYAISSSNALTPDESIIVGRLEKIRNRTEEVYGPETITVSIVEKGHSELFKQKILSLKKDKQKLQDALLELNVKTEIILTDESVETLQIESLL